LRAGGNEAPWRAASFHLVVFGGGDEEEDGGDRVEALEPAPPLRPLAPHVHHLEGNVLDLKVVLVDALGGFASQQDVLLRGDVVLGRREKLGERISIGPKTNRACRRRRKTTRQQNIQQLEVQGIRL